MAAQAGRAEELAREAEWIRHFVDACEAPSDFAHRSGLDHVRTGDVLGIKVPNDDADKTRRSLEATWTLARIAALFDGAEALELQRRNGPDEGDLALG
ncbi:hypothetical protein NKR19_g6558 [Coniochaeta hoffmannii]|uniref:Uncharacterized protein n=1 Tax=Coniochaeta hoffmannii TaxID=91930 RepID=A0AA38VT18_9PEZI|nr:hypothetical protein NKR19_g6558 [Coniochaeta hoffmannii]